MNKLWIWIVGLVGLILIVVALIYFILPANSLPNFFPGYQADLTKHHYKHGIGALLLGLGCFVLVWFQTNKKSSNKVEPA